MGFKYIIRYTNDVTFLGLIERPTNFGCKIEGDQAVHHMRSEDATVAIL